MRMWALIRRRRLDAELDDEISAHLDFATADYVAAGLSPEDARRKARLEFGGAMQTREAYRDREGWPAVEHLIEDVAHAIRVLSKRRALLVTTTLSIAFGVGINVAAYSLLRTILFQPGFTADAPDQLFRLEPGLSYPNYVDVQLVDALHDIAAMQSSTLTYRRSDTTTTIGARVVSDNFFEVFGLHAQYGRTFGTSDGPRTVKDDTAVVISHAFWLRLGGDQSVIGRTLYLNGWPYVITGVLPPDTYTLVAPLIAPSVYVQLGPRVNRGLDARQATQFDVVGRLRPGMTRAQTAAALRIAALDLERRFPDANASFSRTLSIVPHGGLIQQLHARGGQIVLTLAGALYGVVGLVLLVACANVAGLLLARAVERTREISIRIALGATRARLVQQSLAESFVIATLGCIAGAAAWLAITTTVPKTSMILNAEIDLIPLSLSLVQCGLLVVVMTLACGIAPAVMASRRAPGLAHPHFVDARRLAKWSIGQWLVACQVGVAFIMLAGACSLLFTIARQQLADPGFDLTHTVAIEARWPTSSSGPDFFAIRTQLARVPGVEAVSAGGLPVGLIGFTRVHRLGAADDAGTSVEIDRVGPHYLATMGIQLLRGRDFSDEDLRQAGEGPVPVVVGDMFARRYLGSIDVIDELLEIPRDSENGTEARPVRIVGVSKDSRIQIFGGDPVPILFFPAVASTFAVRVNGHPTTMLRDLERAVATIEPGAAIIVAPMSTRLSRVLLPVRIAALTLGVLGTIGLGLAMTGLYGVASYTANRRRVEIGVRIALGATWSTVMRLVLRESIATIGIGSVAGGALSLVLIRAIWPLLAGQHSTTAPLVMVVVFTLTLLVSLGAVLRPALAAASVDPTATLRQE
jgi:putative ABC transport system permease protein